MTKFVLKDNETGYDVIADFIRKFWKHNISDTVIVHLETSFDGRKYESIKEVAYPIGYNDIEFLFDWWEGEKYINLIGIKRLEEVEVTGGIY